MKYLFGINITNDKKNQNFDGMEFLKRKVDHFQEEQLDKGTEVIDNREKTSSLPSWLVIVKVIVLIAWISTLAGIISALVNGTSFSEAYQNAPYLIYIGLIGFVIWLVIYLYERSLKKKVESSPTFETENKVLEQTVSQSIDQLNIPLGTKQVDILQFIYKIKKDEMKVISKGFGQYFNMYTYMFVEGEDLCVADVYQVFSFPLSNLKKIQLKKKKIIISNWNKDEPYTSAEYKPYKIVVNQYGMIYVKGLLELEFEIDGELCYLYLPSYERPAIEEITGMKVVEETK